MSLMVQEISAKQSKRHPLGIKCPRVHPVPPLCLVLLLLLVTGSFALPPAPGLQKNTYTIAVVPQFPPQIIKRDWTPLIKRVSEISGVMLSLKFYRSIPEFEEDFLKGKPDFVYMNPYHAVMGMKAQGYTPLIRDGEQQLIGIIVVPKGSAVKSVRDLAGKKMAFPSPNAFAASLYLRALLLEKEKVAVRSRYVTTHSNVYRHVILGKAAAGGGVNKTLSKEPPELRDMLSIIYKTPAVTPHPLCAHPRVSHSVREAVCTAVLNLVKSREGQELLKAIELPRPVRADYERDYKQLEALSLERVAYHEGN